MASEGASVETEALHGTKFFNLVNFSLGAEYTTVLEM